MSGSEAEYVFLGTLCPVEVHLTTSLGIQAWQTAEPEKGKKYYFFFRDPQSLVSCAGSVHVLLFQKFVQELQPQCSNRTV